MGGGPWTHLFINCYCYCYDYLLNYYQLTPIWLVLSTKNPVTRNVSNKCLRIVGIRKIGFTAMIPKLRDNTGRPRVKCERRPIFIRFVTADCAALYVHSASRESTNILLFEQNRLFRGKKKNRLSNQNITIAIIYKLFILRLNYRYLL